jgi:hypothetical protein
LDRNEPLAHFLGRAMEKIREYREVEEQSYSTRQGGHLWNRLNFLQNELENTIENLPNINFVLELEFTCGWMTLYEIVSQGLKESLLELQKSIKRNENLCRENLLKKLLRMESLFGQYSVQAGDVIQEINRFDEERLKERATKYREFILNVNEKPTRAFCLLGKENNLMDDIEQIKDEGGGNFADNQSRGEYIRNFYRNLYKKKLHQLFAIEDFLGEEVINSDDLLQKKLSNEEKLTLETDVTLEELIKALQGSNNNSSSGWDGISYKVISKFFGVLGPLMVKMAKESFDKQELPDSFKMGQIKLIPKKGNPSKVEDWRPITLLCCAYKLISGVIANRLETFLEKNIDRAQKGFLKARCMSTCTINIMDRIGGAWYHNEPLGVLCIDFIKAFDSVEHEFIKKNFALFQLWTKVYQHGGHSTI